MSSRPESTYGSIQRFQVAAARSVQTKMATRNPLVRVLASATSRIWFPMVRFTARSIPRPLMHRGGRGLARVYYRFRPKYLRASRANLAVIRGEPEESPEVRRLAF